MKTALSAAQLTSLGFSCLLAALPSLVRAASSAAVIDFADPTVISGSGWSFDNNVYTIANGANVTVTGTTATRRVKVAAGATAVLVLQNVYIGSGLALDLTGATAALTLVGENTLVGASGPAIRVPAGSSVAIGGPGSLVADNGYYAAIGDSTAGTIVIDSGTIITGASGDGRIGGTNASITINGGVVTTGITAKGSIGGANASVTIHGGVITANGLGSGAGIGGNGATIAITGGTVSATGDNRCAGIGGHDGGAPASIEISGGVVGATGGGNAAGIGGGRNGGGGSITVTGGAVTAIDGNAGDGVNYALGIGRGYGTAANTTGEVNGDVVIFSSSALDAAIAQTRGVVVEGAFGRGNGSVTLARDATFPSGLTFVIPSGASLTVADGKTLVNDGAILIEDGGAFDAGAGVIVNNGVIYREPAAMLAGVPAGSGPVTFVPSYSANTMDIATGRNLIGATAAARWNFASGILTVGNGATVTLTGTTTANRVVIESGATVSLTLIDATIRVANHALDFAGATVALTLVGENVLQSTYSRAPAMRLTSASTLVITGSGGSLDATGGGEAAGIGGYRNEASGAITINSGIIRATGATGIGGGNSGDGGTITINGGDITAIGSGGGAGIGAGAGKTSATIVINGGTARAAGGSQSNGGAGIGGGGTGVAGTASITITGGGIIATGGGAGAGIGAGGGANAAASAVVAITGGSIDARASAEGRAIGRGGGESTASGEIAGSAVIFASNAIDPGITVTSYAILAQGGAGRLGADAVTLADGAGIPAGYSLVIGAGQTLVVPAGKTLANGGAIVIENGGGLDAPDGAVVNNGAIFVQTGGALNGTPSGVAVSRETDPAGRNIFDLATGANFLGETSGPDGKWSFAAGILTVNEGAAVTLTGVSTVNRVVVATGASADITLAGAEITAPADAPALDMAGATVVLTLVGENTLAGGANQAALRAPAGATLTISGSGSLAATGGSTGAGIGGSGPEAAGDIAINGGTVIATGGQGGAGIGGGRGIAGNTTGGGGGTVVITGGSVNATGGESGGAGIGGGGGGGGGTWTYGGAGGSVTITGGSVNAAGIGFGAGIGGGGGNTGAGAGGVVLITGGSVTATASAGAGIGAGSSNNNYSNTGGDITITGGTVTAISTGGGAGIGGGGNGGAGGNITIAGGAVTAVSSAGAGIGGSLGHAPGGAITISGDAVINATSSTGAAIGSNGNGAGGVINISGDVVITATAGANSLSSIGRSGSGAAATGEINGNVTITASKIVDAGLAVTKAFVLAGGGGVIVGASHTFADDFAVSAGATLTIASGGTLTIPAGRTLSNAGFIVIESGATLAGGGALENTGIILVRTGGVLSPAPSHTGAGRLVAETDPGSHDIFNIGTGKNLFGETTGAGGAWSFASNILTINDGANITVSGLTTANRIRVASGATAVVALENADIQGSAAGPAFNLTGATLVTLNLAGANTLYPGSGVGGASLHAFDAHLVINGPGSLTARHSGDCSGIATNENGSITINGGTITATGSSKSSSAWGAPGIASRGGAITINGGVINATGGGGGAGIGASESNGNIGTITINGGVINAVGGSSSAGIGGGYSGGAPGAITVNGGVINITAGGSYGIGRGGGAAAVTITINGNAVIFSDKPIDATTALNFDKGVVFVGSSGAVAGAVVLADDLEIPSGKTLVVSTGAGLVVPDGKTLVNAGAILIENAGVLSTSGSGAIVNNGEIYREPAGVIAGAPGGSGALVPVPAGSANTMDIATGRNLAGQVSGAHWSFASGVLTVKNGASVTITGTTTANRVVVESGATASITLSGANIQVANQALDLAGATVTLTLEGGSVLESTHYRGAAIRLTDGSTLAIAGSGTLDAIGGAQASGIGGAWNGASGNITVNSGVIRATGATGIGGGYIASSGTITINGGDITAASNGIGAGIGAGNNLATIIINGGVVRAAGGGDGAGIGGGGNGGGGALSVTINGGHIVATGAGSAFGIGRGGNAAGSATVTGEINAPASVIFTNTPPDPDITMTAYALLGPVGPGAADFSLAADLTVPAGQTFLIPAGCSVTVPDAMTLANNGVIIIAAGGSLAVTGGGAIVNDGVIYREAAGSLAVAAGKIVAIADGAARDIIDIGTGKNLFGATAGADDKWSFASNVLTVKNGATVTITGTTVVNRVIVESGATAGVTLLDAGIRTNTNALDLAGATVALTLEGANTLESLGANAAALRVPAGASLTIGGTGSLFSACTGGSINAAGIGGNYNESAGKITIDGGVITAGGDTGIGGGDSGGGGEIMITGGIVTATGAATESGGAGIGAGYKRNAAAITITGGTITATGGAYASGGAGIGGGGTGDAGALSVTITGGVVTATGKGAAFGVGRGGGANASATVAGAITGGAIVIARPGIDPGLAQTGGIVFEGGVGDIVGGTITLSADTALPSGATLLIGEGRTLTIAPGVTFANNGSIYIESGGSLVNNGVIVNNGAVFNTGGTLGGSGALDGNAVSRPPPAGPPCNTIAGGFLHSAFVVDGRAFTAGRYGDGNLSRNVPGEIVLPEGAVVTSVAASGMGTLFLTAEGKVYSDGLGNTAGAVPGSLTTPVAFPDMAGGVVITAIAGFGGNDWSNYGFTLYLDSEGKVHAAGYNASGQLGIGSTAGQSVPKLVTLPAGTVIKAMAAGYQHSLLLAEDGRVYAAGANNSGQLGIGSTDNQSTPVLVDLTGLPSGVTIIAIAAGTEHSLFLGSNGVVYAAGRNSEGQLANGSTTGATRLAATRILSALPEGAGITAIAASGHHSLFLDSDGRVYAAGYNSEGQLGDGTTTNRSTPVPVLLPETVTITAVAASWIHSLFLAADGTLYATGNNSAGQLGDGTYTRRSTPAARREVMTIGGAGIFAGADFSYFITPAGKAYAAGASTALGADVTEDQWTPIEVLPPADTAIAAAAGASSHGLFLTTDGKVYATGYNDSGKLGIGVIGGAVQRTPVPVQLPGDAVITKIALNASQAGHHSLFLTATGKVYVCGYNGNGQLGVGNTSAQGLPVRVVALDACTITGIAAGGNHSLFVAGDGSVFASGLNSNGQLGGGGTAQNVWPAAVDLSNLPAGVNVTAVAAGSNHSLFLGSDGRVYACGYNGYGQLGDGTTTGRATPVPVALPAGAVITAIASGNHHSLFLGSDGTIYAAGLGASGRLGNGSISNATTPAAFRAETMVVDQPVMPQPMDVAVIAGVTPPVKGAPSVTAVTATAQYTGIVEWSPAPVGGRFAPATAYTATITLAPRPGYKLGGVAANFFTVAGASVGNAANSGIVTAAFPATEKAGLAGDVGISGSPVYGATLAALTNTLASDPVIDDLGAPTYAWRRNGSAIAGATDATYTLVAADIGNTITVSVSTANCLGSVTSAATATVAKASQTAPAAPALASKTTASITLTAITGAEYRQGATGAWQESPVFDGLTPGTSYIFQARLKETATHNASPPSAASAAITTEQPAVSSVVVEPAAASVQKGATRQFSAIVAGTSNPAQTVTWTVIGGGAGTTISTDGLLTVATDENADALTVRATSTADPSKHGNAAVTVTEPVTAPSNLRPLVARQVVTAGKSVMFTASAGGHPPPAYQWQVSANGATWSNLADGGPYSGATTATLTLAGVTAALDGCRYRYVATNSAGSIESNAVTLAVAAAVFPGPAALAFDAARNLYVADAGAHTLHKVTPQLSAMLFAGAMNLPALANGTGASARFNQPSALAFNAVAGELLVADKGNHAIRKVTAAAAVTTLATGFSQPSGIALDATGVAYVADAGAHTVSTVTSTGSVALYAGASGTSGADGGLGPDARFNQPTGVVVDPRGELYIADTGNHVIRTEAADGTILLYAGLAGVPGSTDGHATAARLRKPQGMAADSAGHIYFADTDNHAIRVLTSDGEVMTLAGAPGVSGLSDGTGTDALFNRPSDVAFDGSGVLYVADTGNALIRRITFTGTQFSSAQVTALLITSATFPGDGDGGGKGGGGAPTLPALALLAALLALRARRGQGA